MTHIGHVGGNRYYYFFCVLLVDFWFCFGYLDKMHIISCTIETINIRLFKKYIKKKVTVFFFIFFIF